MLPSQMIAGAIKEGLITTTDGTDIPEENIQPASLDLRLEPPLIVSVAASFQITNQSRRHCGAISTNGFLYDQWLGTGTAYPVPDSSC